MDEEEILRSSLEQSNKIDIGNFFGSPIGGLANRALLQSNTSLKSATNNLNLIRALQTSLESLRSDVQQITNYILVDKQERSKILQQRELEKFQREDAIQKGLVRPESAQPTGLEDSLPFFPEARFSEGLTAGMSSIGERQGVARFQERFVEGSRPFFFGGLVPGSGNADTVNAKLTPGEFVVPKNTVENLSPNFFEGLTASQPKNNSYSSSIKYNTRPNMKTGEIEIDPSSLEPGVPIEAAEQHFYQNKIKRLQTQIRRGKRKFGDDYDTSFMESELKKFKGKYNDTLEYGGYDLGDGEKKEEGKGLFGGLFGRNKKNENVRNNDKNVKFNTYEDYDDDFSDPFFDDGVGFDELINDDSVKSGDKRGLFGAIGGTIDAATGNLTDFDRRGGKPSGLMRGITGTIDAATGGLTDLDRRGGKPFGLMRGITGTIDAATGGLTDLDRRGGKPFGLMRGITGSIDAMTGGLTDLDRRGGKPFGTMRLATGVADAMTGNLFDLDRRGKGEEKKKKLRDKDGRYIGDNARKKNFQNMMDKNLYNKVNQLPMETTVNPDGSITSEGSGTFIGGELVKPGEPLTPMQRAAMTMGIQMGNTYSPEIMENYKNSGGSPSKEEFDNYEKEKLKSVRPEEEKSKNLKPEQTLGERFMNIFRGDKKEKSSQLLSSAPSSNTSISSDDSIKTAAQGIMQPPQSNQSEIIELPPQNQGSDGGASSIDPSSPSFKPSTPGYTGLTPTKSPIPFIDVISNQYLSVV